MEKRIPAPTGGSGVALLPSGPLVRASVRSATNTIDDTGDRSGSNEKADDAVVATERGRERVTEIVDTTNHARLDNGDHGHREIAEVLKVAEVAGRLRCGKRSVYNLVHGGHLRSVRVGRHILVPAAALDEFLEGAGESPPHTGAKV